MKKTRLFQRKIFYSIIILSVVGAGLFAGNERKQSELKDREKRVMNYSYYEITARDIAKRQSSDPILVLKNIMVVYNATDKKSPIYGIYRYSSTNTTDSYVGLNLVNGERVVVPKEIDSFLNKKGISKEPMQLTNPIDVYANLAASNASWKSAYLSGEGGKLVAGYEFFDNFVDRIK